MHTFQVTLSDGSLVRVRAEAYELEVVTRGTIMPPASGSAASIPLITEVRIRFVKLDVGEEFNPSLSIRKIELVD